MKELFSRRTVYEQARALALLVVLLFLFVALEFFLGWGKSLMVGDRCLRYLGCNVGPFGFDALVHFTGGLVEGLLFVIFLRSVRRPKVVIYQFLTLAAFAVCTVAAWELIEWACDLYRVNVLHEDLWHPINHYFQLSKSDTVGDMVFGVGGIWIAGTLGFVVRKKAVDIPRDALPPNNS